MRLIGRCHCAQAMAAFRTRRGVSAQAWGLGSARRSWTSSAPAPPGPAAARASAARPAARSPPSAAAQMSARPHRPGWRWRQGCACRRQTFGTSCPASATGPRAGGRRSAAPAQAAPCSWPPGRSRAARSSCTSGGESKRRAARWRWGARELRRGGGRRVGRPVPRPVQAGHPGAAFPSKRRSSRAAPFKRELRFTWLAQPRCDSPVHSGPGRTKPSMRVSQVTRS